MCTSGVRYLFNALLTFNAVQVHSSNADRPSLMGISMCSMYPNELTCDERPAGIACGEPILCCEFDDRNGNGTVDVPEPFEDYLVSWCPEAGGG